MITGDRTSRDGSAAVGKPDDLMLILRWNNLELESES